jgi:hypothetical protein
MTLTEEEQEMYDQWQYEEWKEVNSVLDMMDLPGALR